MALVGFNLRNLITGRLRIDALSQHLQHFLGEVLVRVGLRLLFGALLVFEGEGLLDHRVVL